MKRFFSWMLAAAIAAAAVISTSVPGTVCAAESFDAGTTEAAADDENEVTGKNAEGAENSSYAATVHEEKWEVAPETEPEREEPEAGPEKKSPMMSLKGIFPENRMWNPRKALPKRKPEKRC